MPEENLRPVMLLAIKQLEDHTPEISKIKGFNYHNIHKYFQNDSGVEFDGILCDRILKVCIRDLEEDLKLTADIVHTISVILKRIQSEDHTQLQHLLPCALGIINTLNTISSLNNVTTLRILCVSTFVMFPNDILETIATDHREVLLELFIDKNKQSLTGQSQIKSRIMMCEIVHKVITILPNDKKTEFIKSGISLWLTRIIPTIVTSVSCSSADTRLLDLLETLTDVLLTLNYTDNPQWINILECICNPNKYPLIMKNLLESGCTQWHRLWIVFIRLLNNQITRNTNNVGTPINSMLPVVETAFKMDAANRCKAFHCWSVLINIFSKETNEHCITKRLKLLIIPLKLNNAKVEETAIAKFEAWWLLITKFQAKLDKFFDSMLIGFLHFCFGKHNSIGKTTFIPGQLSMTLKKKGVQAFVEIVGHTDCEGCTDVARLKDRLINTKYLIDHWNDWAHSLKIVMKIAIDDNNRQYILCIWKSFLCVIAQLPDSNVKKGVFIELLTIMTTSLQDCRCENICNDIVFKALIPSLFIKDLSLENILKSIDGQQKGALYKVILIIVDPSLKTVYQSLTTQDIIAKLKPITDFILEETSKCPTKNSLDQILHDLPSNDTTLVLWTAIAESICNSEYEMCLRDLSYILQWPLKSSNMFTDVNFAAKIWYKLYDLNYVNLEKTDIAKHISELLLSSNIVMHSSIYFMLCAVTAILKNGLPKTNGIAYAKEAGLLKTLLKRIDEYENIKEVFPMIIDTLVVMLNHATNNINENFAETTLISVKLILKLVSPVVTNGADIRNIVTLMRLLLKSTESFFEVGSYSKLHSIIVDHLYLNCNNFDSDSELSLKDVIQSLLKKNPIKLNDSSQIVCDSIDLTSDNVVENDADCKFTAPNVKDVPKKVKRKEASIVNTVIENGEEFVVVKSNWKFNPKKLTENQKEKLQRKREDIPALYQDLSQSQDEFKMRVWKTDSQDNSTTSKSSSRSVNEGVDASNLLKNTNSTDLVPKIMENILSDKNKKETDKQSDQSNNKTAKNNSKELQPITPKHKKTPRMALKDRVFRNVRNLIEKSATSSNTKDQNSSCNQIDVTKTPLSKPKDVGNLVNSAPSLLLCDRPSRVKRKPRKFDDSEIFAIKKRRQSQSDSQTCNEELDNVLHTSVEDPVITNDDQGRIEKQTIVIDTSMKQEENLDDAKVVEDINALGDYKSSILDMVNNLETSICVESITADSKMINTCESPNTDRHQNDNIDNDKEKIDPDKESVSKGAKNGTDPICTPKYIKIAENSDQIPSAKKSSVKKSRIEKELAIDMVEGHPFLNTPTTTEMRMTRKNTASPVNCLRRKKVTEKINKTKTDTKTTMADKKEKRKLGIKNTNIDGIDTMDDRSSSPEGVPVWEETCSEDIIESSQDSTLTTITVIKKTPKRLPVVTIEKMQMPQAIEESNNATQNLINDTELDDFSNKIDTTFSDTKVNEKPCGILPNEQNNEKNEQGIGDKETVFKNVKETPEICEEIRSENIQSNTNICSIVESDSYLHESKDDTELPQNKLLAEDKNESELTENMDTAPILEQDISDDVIVINDDEQPVVSVSSDENIVGPQTQELAEADTQSNQTTDMDAEINTVDTQQSVQQLDDDNIVKETYSNQNNKEISVLVSKNESSHVEKTSDVSSPLKDDAQRKQDFLDNTIEISPIKTMSPDLEKKSPSPDRSGDYVVIKLSSPVHSNGEPFEKGSPEFFSEEKISPDKRDQSPPRNEVAVINTSPSSSLSLKKNRPQVRSGGRAAQMLGLCVPDKLNPLMNSDRVEVEDNRKNSPSNTPARRNLRILYNSVGDNSENVGENEENENFLKLKRSLPTVNSSPSAPILKRKLSEITDDTTISPANKRKRVSFHDPPVSTTISVQKYIEPCGVRSPQNSAHKKQERQARMLANLKSPKRLDNLFSLDSVLTKTVESFTDVDISLTNTDDSQMTSLDATPAVEIVKTSELNDTDPICPQLVDCKDSIDNIAVELSSPAMKMLLIKELEGKVVTVGDLAKMTELEVNRLCIKAPKVEVAKKVLMEYATKIETNITDKNVEMAPDVEKIVPAQVSKSIDSAVQTNELVTIDADMQTSDVPVSLVSTQTDLATTSSIGAQTDESGTKTTAEIIQQCISEKPDFVMQLSEQLHECSIQQIANKLSFGAATDTLMAKVNDTNSKIVLDRLLDNQCMHESNEQNYTNQLAFLSDYLHDKFESKDLILFCSELLRKVYNNSA